MNDVHLPRATGRAAFDELDRMLARPRVQGSREKP